MKILIIDNNIMQESWGAKNLVAFATQAQGATVVTRRAPENDLPHSIKGFDRVIISGSLTAATDQAPWIDRLDQLILEAVENAIPTLGVCYGHQSIVRALGGLGTVHRDGTPEYGWTKIHVLTHSRLFAGLPDEFYSFSAHFDEVHTLPPGLVRTAQSRDCAIQAFEMSGKPIYGIQFHPEKSIDEGEKTLESRKKKGTPKVLLHPGKGKKLWDENVGKTIFSNFLKG